MTQIKRLQKSIREMVTALEREVERREIVLVGVRKRVTLFPEARVDGLKEPLGRVLVVDNEILIREVVVDMLEALGYEAAMACSGEEMIRKCGKAKKERNPFDVVIMDLTLRCKTIKRTEAVRELKKMDSSVRIIASSGYPMGPMIMRYKYNGFADRLVKPYHIKDLKRVLMRVMMYH